jgi:AcrR family transcriptional regulator
MSPTGLAESIALPSDRSRLIESMARRCARRGYEKTTISEVLADAQLEREDFDRHFSSKEECAVEAARTMLGETIVAISTAYSADVSETEKTLRGLRAILELFAARPALAELAMVHSRQTLPRAGFEVYESGYNVLSAMLDRLRDNVERDWEVPRSATRAAIGGAEALVRKEIAAGRAEHLPQILPDLAYSVAVAMLGQEEALALAAKARALLR